MQPRLLIIYKPATARDPDLEARLLELLETGGSILAQRDFSHSPAERVREMYKQHEARSFYQQICDLLLIPELATRTKANVYVPKGNVNPEEWAKYVREFIIGATDPGEASPGSFRHYVHLATGETLAKANLENRGCDNGVHCSDSVESGARECAIFFWDYILDQAKIKHHGIALQANSLARDLARRGQGVFFEERLEHALRRRNLVRADEEFMSYKELPLKGDYGWKRRGAETYTAAGRIEFRTTDSVKQREFVAKACVDECRKPDECIDDWLARKAVLDAAGIKTPAMYHREPGTYYEQHLPLSVAEALQQASGDKKKGLIEQVARIAKVLDTRFTSPRDPVSDLRSDGNEICFCDFGEDLGGAGNGLGTNGRQSLARHFTGRELATAVAAYEAA